MGGVLCCDATLVSPLTRTGQPQPCAAAHDGAMLRMAGASGLPTRSSAPSAGGPQRLLVLGSEVGGRQDVTILASPQRALHLVQRFESLLAHHTQLRLNVAKTALWNEAGMAPDGLESLLLESRVWHGDHALEPSSRGLVLLGTPLGSPQFIANHLQALSARHTELSRALPRLGDTQVTLVQPWPLAKIAVFLSLRGSKRAPVARLCTWRTTESSSGLGPRLLGGHVARHCRQWCTWQRWRRQRRPPSRPRRFPLAVMQELSAAALAADLWTATRRPLAASRQAGRGQRAGPQQLHGLTFAATSRSHCAGEAAEVEVDAEYLVTQEAKATVMQMAKDTARAPTRATARQSSWPGPFWDWAVSAGRSLLAIQPFLCAATGAGVRPQLPWRGRQRAQHRYTSVGVDPWKKCRGLKRAARLLFAFSVVAARARLTHPLHTPPGHAEAEATMGTHSATTSRPLGKG